MQQVRDQQGWEIQGVWRATNTHYEGAFYGVTFTHSMKPDIKTLTTQLK